MAIPAYDTLRAMARESAVLGAVDALLNWDQETYMPPAGAANRAEQASAIASIVHEKRTDPRIGDLLAAGAHAAPPGGAPPPPPAPHPRGGRPL